VDVITHLLKSNVECILPMEVGIVCGMYVGVRRLMRGYD
jgi:hypothetical protein